MKIKKIIYTGFLAFFTAVIPSMAQDIMLENNNSNKDDQVPLLYSNTDVEDNIYSVSYITSEELSKTTSLSLLDALKGRLSGYRSVIRGLSSTNQGSVLVLVDGFEQDLEFVENIDIEEVQSVTVHKDAAATALFGQRAANGIISIKTKRGFIGKPEIKVRGTYGMYNAIDLPEYYNSYDYTGFYNEARRNDGLTELYTQSERSNYQNANSELYPSTDWYEEALKDFGSVGKVNMSIRGGNNNVKYFVLANYMNRKGLFDNTDVNPDYSTQEKVDRINLRSNFDIQVLKNTTVRADIGGYITEENSPVSSTYAIFDAIQATPPIIAGRYEDGVYGGNSVYRDNPMALISQSGYAKTHYRAINGAFKLTQDFNDLVEGLKFHGHVNFFNWARYRDNWRKDFAVEQRMEDDTVRFGFDGTLDYGTNITQLRNAGSELYFDYNKSWNDSKLSALLGHRFSRKTQGGQNQTYSQMGFFGKASYSNKDKYFADIILAYNGSQNFAEGNRYGFFPTLALGWKASDESFMEDSESIDLLKFRGSVGLSGSQHVSPGYRFMYFQQYSWSGGYNLSNDNSWNGGIIEGMPAYENAKWENSLKANLGLDLVMYKNLSFGLDVFVDKRTDILVPRSGNVPDVIGIDLPLDNLGEVTSRGIETTLGYKMEVNDFTFNIDGYFNYNKSKIVEMNEIPRSEDYLERTGLPVGQYFGLEAIGFFRDQADIDGSPTQLFSAVEPGDIKYRDQNNDGVVDEFDEVAIGRSWVPEIIYAFTPSISYKGVTVEALFEGVANRSMMLNTSQFWGFYNQRNIASNAVEGRWTESNKENATVPRLTTMENSNNYRSNDLWLADGSFLKLRLLEVRYDVPTSIVNKLNLEGLQVYLRGNNLLSFDKIENADPENLGPVPSYSLKNIGIKIAF
jgi:TonB-linked SusC/RagA family outer membrane protein